AKLAPGRLRRALAARTATNRRRKNCRVLDGETARNGCSPASPPVGRTDAPLFGALRPVPSLIAKRRGGGVPAEQEVPLGLIPARAAAGAHARERILAAPPPRLRDTLLEEAPGTDRAARLDSSLIVREASGLERGCVGRVAPAGALDEEVARTRMGLSVRDAV